MYDIMKEKTTRGEKVSMGGTGREDLLKRRSEYTLSGLQIEAWRIYF